MISDSGLLCEPPCSRCDQGVLNSLRCDATTPCAVRTLQNNKYY